MSTSQMSSVSRPQSVASYVHELAVKARAAAGELAKLTTEEKNAALMAIADGLERDATAIIAANRVDVENARKAGLKASMVDRLTLTETRFKSMVEGVRQVAKLPDPVGEEIWTRERPSGITIRKVRVPFGVVAVVFESRPNVFIDTAALCLKTGNAIILRGGKEAIESNKALAKSVAASLAAGRGVLPTQGEAAPSDPPGSAGQMCRQDEGVLPTQGEAAPSDPQGSAGQMCRQDEGVLPTQGEAAPSDPQGSAGQMCRQDEGVLPTQGGPDQKCPLTSGEAGQICGQDALVLPNAIQLVEILDHEAVTELVRSVGLIDVAIPRGGERLIRAMCEAALIPVLKHYKGVCHVYVDDKADLGVALDILDNAKTQRPGVCNAAECLLVHEKLAPLFLPMVEAWAKDKGVVLHREDNDWEREFLALEMNVGLVTDYRAAIDHINRYGSHHSDCIVTLDESRAKEFLRDVDSAAVYHNVSTRFTDGAEFGMGAEIGISTDKLHARGPMGLEELTTYKYQVTGDGVVRK